MSEARWSAVKDLLRSAWSPIGWLGGHSRFMGGTTYLGTLVGDELGGHCYDMDMCEH